MNSIAQFNCSRTVRQIDTDASGFAHFSSYIRMMEETEYSFLRSRGLSVVLYDQRGTLGFPRLSASVQIHEPVRFDETLEVQLRLIEMDGKQISYVFDLLNSTKRLAVEGRFQVACCRFPDGKPPYAILLPEFVIEALENSPARNV